MVSVWLKTLFRRFDFFLSKRLFIKDELRSRLPYVITRAKAAKPDEVTFVGSLLKLPGYTTTYHYTFSIWEVVQEMMVVDTDREDCIIQSDTAIATRMVRDLSGLNSKDEVRAIILRMLAQISLENSNIPSIVTMFDDNQSEKNTATCQIFWYHDNLNWSWKSSVPTYGFDKAKAIFVKDHPAWTFSLEEDSAEVTLTAFLEPSGPLAELIPHLPAYGIVAKGRYPKTSYAVLFRDVSEQIDMWEEAYTGKVAKPYRDDEPEEDPTDVVLTVQISL